VKDLSESSLLSGKVVCKRWFSFAKPCDFALMSCVGMLGLRSHLKCQLPSRKVSPTPLTSVQKRPAVLLCTAVIGALLPGRQRAKLSSCFPHRSRGFQKSLSYRTSLLSQKIQKTEFDVKV